MNPLLATAVFAVVLFIYIHIYHNIKVSNDLEVYEVESPSKERLEEICDIRQPAIFSMDMEELNQNMSQQIVCDRYGAFDVNIRNADTEFKTQPHTDSPKQLFVPLALSATVDMLSSDKSVGIFSEKNSDFLAETGLINQMRHSDGILRPHMVSRCSYDWSFGANGTRTPFRYELDYRNYLVVNEGSIRVKLAPPKSEKYLYLEKDYVNFEFKSKVNPWFPQYQYKTDFNKVKCLEINLLPGQVLYIPAYWFYSVEFGENASFCKFSYQTYMGSLSVIHYHTMAFLQRNNTRDKVAKLTERVSEASSIIQPTEEGEMKESAVEKPQE